MWTIPTISLVFAAFLAGGFAKGVVGLGFPVIVLACLASTLGLKEAIALLIVPGIVTNIWQALAGNALGVIIRRLWPLLAASIAGIWIGVAVLSSVDTRLLIGILGVLLCTYSTFSLTFLRLPPPGRHEAWMSPLMGGLGGLTFGLTGSYMVPGVLYIQTLGLKRDVFVQALGITFCLIMVSLGLFMSQRQLVPLETAAMSAATLVPTALGMVIGQRSRPYLSEPLFRTTLFVFLCLSGLYMIFRTFW